MRRTAFTAVEALLTIGVIAVTAGIAIPLQRSLQSTELEVAASQTVAALRRSQQLALAGIDNTSWGVFIEEGKSSVFPGTSYPGPGDYETFEFSPSILVEGLDEVAFLASGQPTAEGEIIFSSSSDANSDRIILTITGRGTIAASPIAYGQGGTSGGDTGLSDGGFISGDTGSTDGGTDGGDTGGETGSTDGGSTSGDTGSTDGGTDGGDTGGETGSTDGGSTSGDTGSTDGGTDGGDTGGDDGDSSGGGWTGECEDRFGIAADNSILTTGAVNARFKAIGSAITYGAGGPEVQVHVEVSTDNGSTWSDLFNGADIDGGEEEWLDGIQARERIALRFTGRYTPYFYRQRTSTQAVDFIKVLRNGDNVPNLEGFAGQSSIESFLYPYVTNDGHISIGTYDAIYLVELGATSTTSSSHDLQDAVILVTFDQEEAACDDSSTDETDGGTNGGSTSGDVDGTTGGTDGGSTGGSQTMTICHITSDPLASSVTGETMTIDVNDWPTYEAQGDVEGACNTQRKIQVCHLTGNDPQSIEIYAAAWDAHEAHGDHQGSCDSDGDGDGVRNIDDLCPNTRIDNPRQYLLFFRQVRRNAFVFFRGPRSSISEYNLVDTSGCSCNDILDVAEGKPGHYIFNHPRLYFRLRNLLEFYVKTARQFGCTDSLIETLRNR